VKHFGEDHGETILYRNIHVTMVQTVCTLYIRSYSPYCRTAPVYCKVYDTPHSNQAKMLAKIKSAFFKEFAVTEKCPVKKFVEKQGLEFVRGKVFYQLTKKENVQNYKEVLVKKKATGECIVGEDVKALLDINDGKIKLDINEYPDFDIFIQSSSYNRVLHPDTLMLYQVKDFEIDEKKPVAKATKRPLKTDEETKSTKKPCLIEDKPTNITKANGGGSRDVEVAFSFDTTGSMYACLAEVRRGLKEAIVRLKKDVPGIRIAIIAHGDYCDARSTYVTKIMNFSTDVEALLKFVQEVGSTGGGDADECYELVLKEARTKLGWTKGSTRSLVMIGDCNPHGPNYPLNVQKIDWRTECGLLKEEGVRIYAVQALNRKEATKFYRELATRTDGFHLFLDQFSSIVNFMMAICFKEEGGQTLDEYETEVVSGGKKMNRELHRLFATLQGREPK